LKAKFARANIEFRHTKMENSNHDRNLISCNIQDYTFIMKKERLNLIILGHSFENTIVCLQGVAPR